MFPSPFCLVHGRGRSTGSCSIANPDVAHDAFAVRRDHDASLDIAVGSVAVRGRRDDDPAAVIAVVMVVVVVMMGVERMVMMVVVMVIELRELQQRLRLLCPGQIIRDESLEGIRNRLQQVGKGLSRGGGRGGRRCIGGVEGQ
jgi:hypothetical protein